VRQVAPNNALAGGARLLTTLASAIDNPALIEAAF